MDASGLKTLNAITSFHFRSRAPLFRSLHFAQFKHKLHLSLSSPRFSPICSLHTQTCIYVYEFICVCFSCLGWMWFDIFFIFTAERAEESSLPLPRGAGEAVSEEVSRRGFSITSGTTECCKCFQRHQLLDLYFFSVSLYNPNCSFFFLISLGIWSWHVIEFCGNRTGYRWTVLGVV